MSDEERTELNIYTSHWVAACRLPSYQREVHSVFDELIHRAWGRAEWQPDVEVIETAEAFIMEVDLPGVEEGGVQVVVQGRRLIVEGERVIERPENTVRVYVSERPHGRFQRTFEFRLPIEAGRIRKSHKNGVLTLILPKQRTP